MRRTRWTAIAAVAALCAAAPAAARPTPTGGSRPWAEEVDEEDQREARRLFEEGNQLLRESLFPGAVEKYREALDHWDHPAIHYNLALALVNLDQPIEMFRALEAAMRFGPGPLDSDKFERARALKILVERQLAHVEYTVEVAGAILSFDGRAVFTGPGTWKQMIIAGEHAVVVRADGYLPVQFQTKIAGGEVVRRTLVLLTEKEGLIETYPFSRKIPIAIGLVGVGILGGGLALHQASANQLADYDAGIQACAATDATGGCTMPPAGLFEQRTSAETRQTVAFTAYAIGGAALAAGVTLYVLNRPSLVRRDAQPDLGLAPVMSPGLTGVAAGGRF